MLSDKYIGFTDLAIAVAFQNRIFISAGYPAGGGAQRYARVYSHPDAASRPGLINYLVIVKEIQMWGPKRRESPETTLMSGGEKTLIKTVAEWQVDGFFPERTN